MKEERQILNKICYTEAKFVSLQLTETVFTVLQSLILNGISFSKTTDIKNKLAESSAICALHLPLNTIKIEFD